MLGACVRACVRMRVRAFGRPWVGNYNRQVKCMVWHVQILSAWSVLAVKLDNVLDQYMCRLLCKLFLGGLNLPPII